MMSYQDRMRKTGVSRRIIISIFIVFLLFIILLFKNFFSRVITTIASPVFSITHNISNPFHSISTYFQSKTSLELENERLKKEQAEIRGYLHAYRMIVEENEALRRAFGRERAQPPIFAVILAKPPQSPYDTLLLDVGEKEGVRVGAVVFSEEMISVGSIIKVSDESSVVELYSTPNKKTVVRLEDGEVDMELVGRGGGNFEIEFPRDAVIQEGSHAYLPGTSLQVIAQVGPIISDPRDPYKKVLLTSPVNINQLNRVFVSKAVLK